MKIRHCFRTFGLVSVLNTRCDSQRVLHLGVNYPEVPAIRYPTKLCSICVKRIETASKGSNGMGALD